MPTRSSWSVHLLAMALAVFGTPTLAQSSIVSALPHAQPISVPGVPAALKAFFGSARGRYIEVGGSLYHQFMEAYRGGSDGSITLGNGDIFTASSRPGEGDERAAAIFDPFGRVAAAALISHHCSYAKPLTAVGEDANTRQSDEVVEHAYTTATCDTRSAPTMTIFIRDTPFSPLLRAAFRSWARRALVGLQHAQVLPVDSKIFVERRYLKH